MESSKIVTSSEGIPLEVALDGNKASVVEVISEKGNLRVKIKITSDESR